MTGYGAGPTLAQILAAGGCAFNAFFQPSWRKPATASSLRGRKEIEKQKPRAARDVAGADVN
jgi:hypothetical protein